MTLTQFMEKNKSLKEKIKVYVQQKPLIFATRAHDQSIQKQRRQTHTNKTLITSTHTHKCENDAGRAAAASLFVWPIIRLCRRGLL